MVLVTPNGLSNKTNASRAIGTKLESKKHPTLCARFERVLLLFYKKVKDKAKTATIKVPRPIAMLKLTLAIPPSSPLALVKITNEE